MKIYIALLTAALVAIGRVSALPVAESPERPITLPDEYRLKYAYADPAGAFAVVCTSSDGDYIDRGRGFEGPFKRVYGIIVSHDGKKLAYYAEKPDYRDEWIMYEGERSFGPYSCIARPAFSGDGSSLGWAGYIDNYEHVILDGEDLGCPTDDFHFIGAGSGWAFIRRDDDGTYSILSDHGASGPWTGISMPVLTLDHLDIIIRAQDSSGRWLCTAYERYGPFISLTDPDTSSDGHTPEFWGHQKKGPSTIWTHRLGASTVGSPIALGFFPEPSPTAAPAFSPDGARMAAVRRSGEKLSIEESGLGPIGPFDSVDEMRYSKDGSTFVARVGGFDGSSWLYGSGYKVGPFKPGDDDYKWLLSPDGAELTLWWSERRVPEERYVERWSRERGLIEHRAEAFTGDPWNVGSSERFPGVFSERDESGSYSIRTTHGVYGPASDPVIYARTDSGGVVYSYKSDGIITLFLDDRALLSGPEGSFMIRDAEGGTPDSEDDEVIVIMDDYRFLGSIAVARGKARGMTTLGADGHSLVFDSFGREP